MTNAYLERLAYTHDRNTNVVARENLFNGDFSETYTNDQLNRLADWQRENGREQVFDMDALGNFTNVATDGVDEERTSNAQNQLTSVEVKTSPEYDSSGNMTRDELGQQYISDAWNRLVVVNDEHGHPLMTFAFDALGRRILDNDTHLYFDGTNIVEERNEPEASATVQYVWNPLAINTLVLRDRDADANFDLEERVYALHNANNDVTAIVDANGNVLERYVYDPYGVVTFLDANWDNQTPTSTFGMQYLFQDGRFDAAIGNYRFGAREYRPSIQVWMSEDPVWRANLYAFVSNNPLTLHDPSGLDERENEKVFLRSIVVKDPRNLGGLELAKAQRILSLMVDKLYSPSLVFKVDKLTNKPTKALVGQHCRTFQENRYNELKALRIGNETVFKEEVPDKTLLTDWFVVEKVSLGTGVAKGETNQHVALRITFRDGTEVFLDDTQCHWHACLKASDGHGTLRLFTLDANTATFPATGVKGHYPFLVEVPKYQWENK